MTEVLAATSHGRVRGQSADGIVRFLGIPYASAPRGIGRFAAPEPVRPWAGVRAATEFGATAPAVGLSGPGLEFLVEPAIPGEEYLNLNVWTPGVDDARRPVLVWIHGGAHVTGSSAQPIFDGQAFAANGIVFVSFNYRLGAEGHAQLPDAPANRALLDQRAALEWVRREIAAFGGDPDRVTVSGSSAGASAVLSLLSLDTGLLHRAVVQSVAARSALSTVDAERIAKELADQAGVPATAAGLATVAPQRLAELSSGLALAVMADPDPLRWGESVAAASMAFGPVVDGHVLPHHPYQAVLDGAGRDTELLIGTNSDELLLLTQDEATSAALTELVFREPVYALAESRSAAAATYVYEFGWRSPLPGAGAAHGLELGFVFDNLGHSTLEGEAPPQDLARAVNQGWTSFAANGDPGWPPFTDDTPFVRWLGG
ncbi:carboxylesterase/lipase family protein [Crossiella cryophila]|uniref:Carboxylic ester hydrolase n=1 Tax=Crossiella cryophila TaxID=43355 RepID=A0A7W7FW12_9PSEU|nr:carboxylesterase family protein [Crossiella cryophila]MBB4677394.1 para-nitrobenzyl esterase [Crossiella cryophila]